MAVWEGKKIFIRFVCGNSRVQTYLESLPTGEITIHTYENKNSDEFYDITD